MNIAERIARGADRAHQRRPWIAFPYAVVKKFGDDQAGNLAALVSYYGFFSLFPLMLVLVTVLGMLLQGNIELQGRIESSALVNFPVIGDQISSNVHPLRGSGLALGIGIALSLWAGLGVLKVMQTAMNAVWNVPYRYRPNFVRSILKAAMMLGVLGVLTLAAAAAGSVGAGSDNWLFGILGVAISLLLNFILFMLAFPILTTADLDWADVRAGAVAAARPAPHHGGPALVRVTPGRHRRRRRVDRPAGPWWVLREPSAAGSNRDVRHVRHGDRAPRVDLPRRAGDALGGRD